MHNTTDVYRVTFHGPDRFDMSFLIEAITETDATVGVKLALRAGILPPHMTNAGWFAPVITNAGVPSLRTLLSWPSTTEKLNGYPHILVFPDPGDRDEWVRYQLSWYGRLWEDIQKLWLKWFVAPWQN